MLRLAGSPPTWDMLVHMFNIDTIPCPRSKCGLCKKMYKVSDNITECVDCEKRFHAKCSKLGIDELIKIENGSSDWYCTNCKADCDLCSCAVLNGHKAVQCDDCELWIYNARSNQRTIMKMC